MPEGMPLIAIGFLGSLAAGAAPALGVLPILLVRELTPKAQGTLMGFSAGIMLAASTLG